MATQKRQKDLFNEQYVPLAKKACEFLTNSPDPYHAVSNSIKKLKEAGFQQIHYHLPFTASNGGGGGNPKIVPGGKYYYHVHHSALVAFVVGGQVDTSTTTAAGKKPIGFHMIGGHTDSPNLKLKPNSKKATSAGTCKTLGVQTYGGGLWHTWLDRDLSISGKVLVKTAGKVEPKLVKLDDPIARVSSLCIHFQNSDERKALPVNQETHTVPTIGNDFSNNEYFKQLLERGAEEQINATTNTDTAASTYSTQDVWHKGQEPYLLQTIASELNLDNVDQIVDWDLNLYDTQSATIGGICNEFLYSARLDNLATVFCAVESLVDYSSSSKNDASTDVSIIVAFDHEEVGSRSPEGAGSPIMQQAIQRILSGLVVTEGSSPVSDDFYATCIERSFIMSVDQAHAIHPNYSVRHESQHAPALNNGIVIKTNANQRYTTNSAVGGYFVRELGRLANIPIQEFCVKNDCPCGSTIGPTLSAETGIRAVDAGMPQLSMHSCREVMGIADCKYFHVKLGSSSFLFDGLRNSVDQLRFCFSFLTKTHCSNPWI